MRGDRLAHERAHRVADHRVILVEHHVDVS
jgi:hypothetical protein